MEIEITKRLLIGCEESFEAVYYSYRDKLYFYFLKRIKDQSVCKDLVQDTFVKLWRYRTSLRTDLSLSLQIFRIAKTSLIDVLKKQAQHRIITVPEQELHTIAEQEREEENEHVVYLKREIKALPPIRKKIIEYRLQGLTNQEIADLLAISKRTVENQLNKAFSEIKKNADIPTLLICLIIKATC
jgi:RNA polymerase sigma-70 factor (ECF subfamily)